MRYRFGVFELDEEERQLRRSGAVVDIGDRAFDLLCTLLAASGRLLSKDVLLDAVWPNLFVTENNLQVQVSGLRRILGPDAITTVSGRGYRFNREVAAEDQTRAALSQAAAPIGREGDLARLIHDIGPGRIVTITGAGGIGKTTLARAVADRRRAEGANVAWVELAPLREPGLIVGLVADAFAMPLTAEATAADLAAALRPKGVSLLVLDNAEHLLEEVAILAAELANGLPDVAILITSQAPLRVRAELVHRIDGLDLPLGTDAEAVRASGAGTLFLARAEALDRRFALTDDTASAVAAICRRLDGSPLALELAAARLPLFGPGELEARLDRRFDVLTSGYRTAPTRQQTLQAVLDWSYGLLPEAERVLFRRLGAFNGPFSLVWACRVGQVGGGSEWAVVDALGDLLDRCLVEAADAEAGIYRLTETARAFALEQLVASRDRLALKEAVELHAEAGAAAVRPVEQVGAFSTALALQRRLEALGAPVGETLALLLKLGPAVQAAISPADARCGEIYREALHLAEAGDDPRATFHANWGAWHYECMSGRVSLAEPYLTELVRFADASGDDGLQLEASHAAVTTYQLLGDAAAVVAASRQAQGLYDPARHRCLADAFGGHDAGLCACGQGAVGLALTGAADEALAQAAEAVRQGRESEHAYSRAVGLFYAAMTFQCLGDTADFRASAEALKSVSDEAGMAVLASEAELLAAGARFEAGDRAAVTTMQRAFEEITGSGDTGFGMYYAALVAVALLSEGDRASADQLIERALTFAAEGQGFFLPELHRLRAQTRPLDAAVELETAIRIAHAQGARLLAERAEADMHSLAPPATLQDS